MRLIDIFFIKDYKAYVDLYGKKTKSEYILNVNKLVRDKLGSEYLVPNKTQAFLLNYEIRKLINKVLGSKSKKYSRIVYLNTGMSQTGIMNAVEFLSQNYSDIEFKPIIVDLDSEYINGLLDYTIINKIEPSTELI